MKGWLHSVKHYIASAILGMSQTGTIRMPEHSLVKARKGLIVL